MLKAIFRLIFPKAPVSVPQATTDQVELHRAIIAALARHIQQHGDRIITVKVPGYVVAAPDAHFTMSGVVDFAVVSGLDAYGTNVVIEENPYRVAPKSPSTVAVALNEMVAATANTASATTEATTVSAVKAK